MATALALSRRGLLLGAAAFAAPPPRDLRTPYKRNRLVLAASGKAGAFDEKAVDCPFVYRHGGRYHMIFVGFDGAGYQTGRAVSGDLVGWRSEGLLLARDPSNPIIRHNVALSWIVRDNDVFGAGELKRIRGRYLGVYHAYPGAGYEQGSAVIGLAWSSDLDKWELEPPCLRAEDGAEWERGGLYKPCLVEHRGAFYLFYNAKTTGQPWREQTGVAVSRDLRVWTRHPASPILRNGGAGSPDERFASDPCVLRYRGGWAFFYFGLDARGAARDLLAVGRTPFAAEKCEGPLIDVGGPGSIDERYAHKPALIARAGVLYHFYCAVSKNNVRGVSLAASAPLG